MNKEKLQKFSNEFFAVDEFQEKMKTQGNVLQESIHFQGHRIPEGATVRVKAGKKK